jgi:hypothetical protein
MATGCLFKVGYSSWEPWECAVRDEGGTLTVSWPGAGDKGYLVRLVVAPDGATAEAAWSGFAGGAHSTEPLGILSKDSNCWFNETARLCFTRQAKDPPPSSESIRETELNAYYPCATHLRPDDKERLNDYANATKTDPCVVATTRQAIDELALSLEIAQEVEGDEEEAERALNNDAGSQNSGGTALAQAEDAAPNANASSFRGLQLGMTQSQIAAAMPQQFQITSERPSGDVLQALTGFAEQFTPNTGPRTTVYIVNNAATCGEVTFVDDQADRLRLYQCFFDMAGGMSIDDFAQQVTNNYQLEDGMAGRWEMRGDGAYRFRYTEYVGVRRATSERFTASLHEMNNVLTLTVERVPSVNFN